MIEKDNAKDKSGFGYPLLDEGFRVSAENNYYQLRDCSIGLAILEHWHTKGRIFAVLKKVDEDDCNFRTVDDNSELSYDWTVIFWAELKDPKTFI